MRLPFKPQSTPYTCVQAVQAIALNHYLGTNYSDLDVVDAQGGYLLPPRALHRLHESTLKDVAPERERDSILHYKLSVGIIKFLGEHGSLPSLDDTIHAFAKTVPDEDAERSISDLEEKMSSGDMHKFYEEFSLRMHNQLLVPLNYNVDCDHTDSRPVDSSAGIVKLSEGKITVFPYEDASFDSYTTEDGILKFASRRDYFNLPTTGDHEWVVDRKEGENFVLLDTNHSAYGHGPEVYVPLTILNEMLTNHHKDTFMKTVAPFLVNPN